SPRSSDGGRYWLYNPGGSAITITPTSNTGPLAPIIIPAQGTALLEPGATTGIRLQGTGNFYAVVTLDDDFVQDWGFAIQPVENLTTQVLVGWGVGDSNNPPTTDHSRVYVTALTTTTLHVDFDNDTITDTSVTVNPLEEVSIVDPDHDLSGAFIFSTEITKTFVSAWGQDSSAVAGAPAIDVGTSIVPIPFLSLQKTVRLFEDRDQNNQISWGDILQYSLNLFNDSAVILDPVVVDDTLPPEISYVTNSTVLTSPSSTGPVPDSTSGTAFPVDDGINVTLPPRQSGQITFQAEILPNVTSVTNSASANCCGLPPSTGSSIIPIQFADYEMDKHLIDPVSGIAQRNGLVTYGITITSTGNLTLTVVPLRDQFADPTQVTLVSTDPVSDSFNAATGTITWTNVGPIGPTPATREVTVTVRVNNLDPNSSHTIDNTATTEGVQGSNGVTLPTKQDSERVTVPPFVASYSFDKRIVSPANRNSTAGGTVTFALELVNTGAISITELTLSDTVNRNHLIFQSSSQVAPDINNSLSSGTVTWNTSIVSTADPFLPGETIVITTTYRAANPITVPQATNTANVTGVRDILGNGLANMADTEFVNFPSCSCPSPSDGGDNGADPIPTPPPPAPASDFTPPPAEPLPVTLLPETGYRQARSNVAIWGIIGLAVVGVVALRIHSKRKKERQNNRS
ncbi:MAG: hypothetical protein R3264_06860, partial [Anaerolineae bacterium]|nr:hypothetical protein [Anaerolineae bacterium]